MQETNKLILPKGYLSWSAMNCWRTNKERFRKEYFECGEKLDTKYLQFGKGIAKMIEEGKHKELLPTLIVDGIHEHEVRVNVQCVPILSYLDLYCPDTKNFREYKTGTQKWDQARVQKHDQLLFYAVALKWKEGYAPKDCDLDWIETRVGGLQVDDFWHENEGLVNVTGKILSFHRVFDPREIERMEKDIIKTANEISEAYKNFIKEI